MKNPSDNHRSMDLKYTRGLQVGNNNTQTNIFYSETYSGKQIRKGKLIPVSPYKGLASFETNDKGRFFGRKEWIDKLQRHLSISNQLLLLGASGSGKSSLIRAGLIPAITDGHLAIQGNEWTNNGFKVILLVPGDNPFEGLFCGLIKEGYSTAEAKLAQTVHEDTLLKVIDFLKKDESWLLFIDQFEEIFTTTCSLDIRQAFFSGLIKLIHRRDESVKLVMTMRSDFYSRLSQQRVFMEEIQEGQSSDVLLLTDMSHRELRLAIQEPAAQHHVTFETASSQESDDDNRVDQVPLLVDIIVDDFDRQSGSLPLLQFTLDQLWKKNKELNGLKDQVLTIEAYEALGGVKGSLENYADSIYNALNSNESDYSNYNEEFNSSLKRLQRLKGDKQEIVKEIFLALVDLDADKPVRRRADKTPFSDGDVKQAVLDCLIKSRLIVSAADGERIEIAHDILLQSWNILERIVNQKRHVIYTRNRLLADVRQWKINKQQGNEASAEAELWKDSKLSELTELYKSEEILRVLGKDVEDFVRTARVRDYELALSDRKNTISSLLRDQPLKAMMKMIQLYGESLDILPEQLPDGLKDIARQVIDNDGFSTQTEYRSAVCSVVFSPNGRYIAGGSEDSTIYLWDVESQKLIHTFRGHRSAVNSVAFNTDGTQIASGSKDRTIQLWDVESQKLIHSFRAHRSAVNCVAFNADGTQIISGSDDRTIRLWDVKSKRLINSFRGHNKPVDSVAFNPVSDQFASSSRDGCVMLWDLKSFKCIGVNSRHAELSPSALAQYFHPRSVKSIAFTPEGSFLVSGDRSGDVFLWDIVSNKVYNHKVFKQGKNGAVTSIAYNPANGSHMMVVGTAKTKISYSYFGSFQGHVGTSIGSVFLYDETLDKTYTFSMANAHCHDDFRCVSFDPEGSKVVGCGERGVYVFSVSAMRRLYASETCQLDEDWRDYLAACCDRLNSNSARDLTNIFSMPEDIELMDKACETCEEFIWNSESRTGSILSQANAPLKQGVTAAGSHNLGESQTNSPTNHQVPKSHQRLFKLLLAVFVFLLLIALGFDSKAWKQYQPEQQPRPQDQSHLE